MNNIGAGEERKTRQRERKSNSPAERRAKTKRQEAATQGGIRTQGAQGAPPPDDEMTYVRGCAGAAASNPTYPARVPRQHRSSVKTTTIRTWGFRGGFFGYDPPIFLILQNNKIQSMSYRMDTVRRKRSSSYQDMTRRQSARPRAPTKSTRAT